MLKPSYLCSDQQRVILAVGKVSYQKGFDLLVRAYAEVHQDLRDWILVVVGDYSVPSESYQSIELLVSQYGLENKVIFTGRAGNIADWYERAELFVLSSRFEGFPNVLLEAMAHGCCVIASNCKTGPSEMIEHGVNGFLYDSEDTAALSSLLVKTADDELKRSEMSEAAKAVVDRFSTEVIYTKWDSVLK